jgi:hypothetical protein
MDQVTYDAAVDARAQQILAAAHERGADRSLWAAHALMLHQPDAADVVQIVRDHLWRQADCPAHDLLGGPFEILPCMLLLCRWEKELPPEAEALIHEFMTQAHLSRGNTENHWLMAYGGMLLAAERWPDADFAWSGLPAVAIAAEATRWISGMIERSAVQGHHEYDSTGYHIEHMTAYLGLFEHVQDDALRAQIGKMLHLLVADMALEYFNGAWAGGHSREGYRQNTWTRIGAIQPLQYLYFGGIDFDAAAHTQGMAIPAVMASYHPPAMFAEMAWDRSQAHVVKKTKAPRTIYRRAREHARPVRKYTYMSRSFALGSTQLGLPGTQCGPIDLTSWDLTWDGPDHQATIVCNHPYASPDRFSAFLCDLPHFIRRGIATGKPYLQWPDRLFGASPFERMLQHEGAIIILYDIPAHDEHPFVNLFLPHGHQWQQQEDWFFADMGKFHVAVQVLGAYEWTTILEPGLIDGWLLRIQDRTAGVLLEVVEADEVDSFEQFRRQRAALKPDLSGWPETGRVQMATTRSDHLDLTHGGDHRVNGQVVDYEAYALYDAPGVEAPLGTGRVTFSRDGDVVDVDFGIDPDKPLLPMRVIG